MPRRKNISSQTLRLLAVFAGQPDAWQYGYELSQATALKAGTLYPILMRLADQGWLETRWADAEKPGRPPRHLYRLSAAGREQAARLLEEAAQENRLPIPAAEGARS